MSRLALTGTLLLLAIWAVVTEAGLIKPIFLPSPVDVIRQLGELTMSGVIVSDVLETIGRTATGYLLGSVLGILIGLLIAQNRVVAGLLEFPVDFFRSIPATALFPLFIVFFGLGDQVKIFITAWSSSMVVLINTVYGIRNVSHTRLMVAKLRRVSPIRQFFFVVLPDALPFILAGLRIGLSLALVVQVVAEMFLGSQGGLGYRVFNASSVFDMQTAYAAVLVLGVVGYGLNKGIRLFEAKFVHWSGR